MKLVGFIIETIKRRLIFIGSRNTVYDDNFLLFYHSRFYLLPDNEINSHKIVLCPPPLSLTT